MVLFDFKSDKHFVASSDKTTLKVYELTNPTTVNPSSIGKNHWKEVATITARDQEEEEEEEESYDGLMFFDGHGRIEGREALTKLAQHLTRLQLRVSPQGFCFQDVTGLGEHKEFGFHYLRLNDLFNWPYHGVRMPGIATWRRLVLEYSVPKGEKKRSSTAGGGVSKKKYEELREEMEEQDWELEKLKEERGKHEQELRDLEKKNGKELLKLSRKKDGELETLKREKDEELEDKTEELETLRKEKNEEVKKLREEVRNLKRAKNNGDGGAAAASSSKGKIMVDSDEWHKLKKDEAETRDWLPPPKIRVYNGSAAFDKDNWWFVKTTHPDGGLTMMAYYDGSFHISNLPGMSCSIRLPYSWDKNPFWADTTCTLAMVSGEFKLAFIYRE
ncbi:unnamed protein product [Linum tenue]|uniref:Uncharacterized protein n=1 Tax=Linum tenue TaxID=586396 RepID=A0AAV0RC84_9ROSI|nr:unnamed protein product [Linum tenue]